MTIEPKRDLRILTLQVKGEFFEQMCSGSKPFEYRLKTPFWEKRLVGREYDKVCVTWGYPKATDHARRLLVDWKGFEEQVLQHPFFGPSPVLVFAIRIDITTRQTEGS